MVALLFVISVALRLNGSSSSIWHYFDWADVEIRDSPEGLLLSEPKAVRSDEWLVYTLAALSQAAAEPSFPTSNPSYGPGKVPLIMSLPARHYTMAFRPGLWGYFVLPFEYAFSWQWNLKIFGLFATVFLLLWRLTKGHLGLALSGALIIQFSSFIQWWFSSPTLLPEMLSYWALGTLVALSLFTQLARTRRIVAVAVVVSCLVGFFLCCYPPFEIPLAYLAGCIVIGCAWENRMPMKRGLAALAVCLAAATLLLVPWFLDCRETLELVAQTVYPGHRITLGGELPITRLFSGLFSFAIDETNTPAVLLNICEASNFYPIWWVPIGLGFCSAIRTVARAAKGESLTNSDEPVAALAKFNAVGAWLSARALKMALTAFILLLTCFALVPFPLWFCQITLLSRCTEARNLLPLGIAGLILSLICLRPGDTRKRYRVDSVLVWSAWSVGVLVFLLWAQREMGEFLTLWRTLALGGSASFLGAAYVWGPFWSFTAVLPALLAAKTALANPLCIGLPEMLESRALLRVREIVAADRTALWAGYNSLFGLELIKACGGQVINGLRVVPDFPMLRKLDPAGEHAAAYNRYVHLIFDPPDPRATEVKFNLVADVYCHVEVHPRRLAELYPELKYILLTRNIKEPSNLGLELFESFPQNNIWIYRIMR